MSVIARSEYDGAPVPQGMAISFIHTFVNAGETTRALLSFVAMALAEHPDQRRILVERPELIGNAIEESLRFCPLNWTGCRTATEQIEIGGQVIEAGDYVVMAYTSANRDEDVWDRPDELDVTRSFDTRSSVVRLRRALVPRRVARPDRLDGDLSAPARPVPRLGVSPARRDAGPTRSSRA